MVCRVNDFEKTRAAIPWSTHLGDENSADPDDADDQVSWTTSHLPAQLDMDPAAILAYLLGLYTRQIDRVCFIPCSP